MSFPAPFFKGRPHPWHGLSAGPDPPRLVHAFIEITPFDLLKCETDKETWLAARNSSRPEVSRLSKLVIAAHCETGGRLPPL